ncbi:MAG: ATP-binding protein [Psychroflexus sp.]
MALKATAETPLIFGLFVRINMVEQVGSGVGRIKELMKQASLLEPVFKTERMFTVVLHRTVEKSSNETKDFLIGLQNKYQEQIKSVQEKFGGSSEKIVLLILDNDNITTAEMADIIKISTRAIEKQLAKLKREGIIDRIGPDKGGRWKVLK